MAAPDGLRHSQDVYSRDHAIALDAEDPLRHMRREFIIPSKSNLRANTLAETVEDVQDLPHEESVYLCGNSLGLQPRLTATRIQEYLKTWSTQGVFGHFKPLSDSPLPTWLHADSAASESIAPIVGAQPSEVAVMQTLTANLHFLMAAFYRPDIAGRHKIILESKAFPSDHFVVESQILHHNLSLNDSMITIEPSSQSGPTITTAQILSIIELHASTTALLLLPGIQFYTGQLLDIPTITSAARKAGIFLIWDLAHAVGNVPLHLHSWDVDAAVWCAYKYLNAGPGTIGGLFVHERNTQVLPESSDGRPFTNRLSGWWGSDKNSRFTMDNRFVPIPGAAGFQVSNPSIFDITSLNASLEIFKMAGGIKVLRAKSVKITTYLESQLHHSVYYQKSFDIITPRDQEQRGAQLSVRLLDGSLDVVMKELEERGVIVDERRPDVIRVAPASLYNSFEDVHKFALALDEALEISKKTREGLLRADGTRELGQTT
ncbi:hypothetical protein B7494_g6053 [Chlorociboria aeruginascens]|nr:hypothetical protein B7494_g6053 [Chlorociboria aeruginascens]